MKIDYYRKFTKNFVKLPEKIKSKFYEKLRLFEENPHLPILDNHSVENIYPNWRSINITGDYRALFELKNSELVVFMRIGTHSELYG